MRGSKNKISSGSGDRCGDEKQNFPALRGSLRGSKKCPRVEGFGTFSSLSCFIVARYVIRKHVMGKRASNRACSSGIQPFFPKITPDEAKSQRDRRKLLDLKRFERLKKFRLETQKKF